MIPTEVIHLLVFFSLLTLPSTVLSSTNLYVLNLVRHVEKEKKIMSTNITTAYHILFEENSNLSDTSVFSATFVVFFSMLSLPSMVSSATNSHVLNVVRHVESIKKNSHVNHNCRSMSHQVEKIPTEVIHPICHWPSWFPSPCRPYRPRCRRPPAHMYLILSNMLKLSWTFMSTTITTAYHILVEETPTEVIHPNASDLPGLLLQLVLAVHSVVNQQLTCT